MPFVRLSKVAERQLRLSGFLQYGFLDILCEYSNLDFESVSTQLTTSHGMGGTPEQIAKSCQKLERAGITFLSWGNCPRTSRTCLPIGSPWLYLLKMSSLLTGESLENHGREPSKKQIFVIPHSSTSQRYRRDTRFLVNSLTHWISSLSEPDSVVLFHWADFLNEDFVNHFRPLNLQLKCVGYGGHPNSLSSFNVVGGRPNFLRQTLSLLQETRELNLIEPSTLGYYASSLAVPIRLADDKTFEDVLTTIYPESSLGFKKQSENRLNVEYHLSLHKWLSEMNTSKRKIEAQKILGVDSIKSEVELARILTSSGSLVSRFKRSVRAIK